MSIIHLLVPLAALLGLGFGAAFVCMALQGQFEDLDSPAHRILLEEVPRTNPLTQAQEGTRTNAT